MSAKIGIIGLGRWAEKIVRTLQKCDVEIVAACQRKSERPNWLPNSCQIFDNANDMLRKSILTHLIIATPPQANLELARKGIQYGLSIWLEKPIALSYEETQHIFDLGGSIFIDHIHLYSEAFQYLCNEVKSKLTPRSIIRTEGFTFGPNPAHDFSILYDVGPHDLSMLLPLFDDIIVENIHKAESKNGDYYNIQMIADNGCQIFTRIGNDGSQDKSRLFEVDIDEEIGYIYDGLQQKVYKNGVEVFAAKRLPLERAIEAFLQGEQADKNMVLKMIKILDEVGQRTK